MKRRYSFYRGRYDDLILKVHGSDIQFGLYSIQDYLLENCLFTPLRPVDLYELVRVTGQFRSEEFSIRRGNHSYEGYQIKAGPIITHACSDGFQRATRFRMKPGEVRRYYFRRVLQQ